MSRAQPTRTLVVILVLCLAAVAAALVSQHVFGMQPCPWCVLQRLIFLGVALACLVGIVWRRRPGSAISGLLAALLGLCGGAAALWQHFVAASSTSCNLTLADRIVSASTLDSLLPAVFEPRASCADAAVKLFGIPYDMWSLAAFVIVIVLAARVLGRR